MPELPEVETVRKGLIQGMLNKTFEDVLVRREGLRYPFPDDLATLAGTTVVNVRRRAKYLLIDLSDDRVLLSHLGMSGRYTLFDSDRAAAAKPLLQTVNGGVPVSTFGDETGHGGKHDHIDLFPSSAEGAHKLLASLGPEPFDPWDAKQLAKRLQGRKTPIKLALLDQKTVVGVGNIYVCESLFRAGLSPRREAGGLVRKNGAPTKRLEVLVGHIKDVISEAIEAGGSTLNDFASVDGTLGYFAHQFAVYGREGQPCEKLGCGGVVRRLVQSNRSTFYCPTCQR